MEGIADVINLRALGTSNLSDYMLGMYKNDYNAKRSGDLQIVTQPGWLPGGATGTNHGSPYNYDTHVPFLLYGWGINKGETLRRTTISDIAPTISALLHILPPSGNVGNAVDEALIKITCNLPYYAFSVYPIGPRGYCCPTCSRKAVIIA